MANSGDHILSWCELESDPWKADRSGFVTAVCSLASIALHGNANHYFAATL
jgi:hypothetical protein